MRECLSLLSCLCLVEYLQVGVRSLWNYPEMLGLAESFTKVQKARVFGPDESSQPSLIVAREKGYVAFVINIGLGLIDS